MTFELLLEDNSQGQYWK